MSYRFENTESYRLVMELRKALSDVMEVPNEWLPESYHTARGSRTLASVEREMQKRQAEKAASDHEQLKANKAELIEAYAAKVERGEELFAA